MVKEQVSNTAIGRMRMQFWRDAIKSVYNVRFTYPYVYSKCAHSSYRVNLLSTQLQ